MGKYDDIINLPYPPKNKKTSISPEDRAAQFGSFKALTGFEDEIEKQAVEYLREIDEADNGDDITD